MQLLRKEFKQLQQWYSTPIRKTPCVLFGARQVGKSTLAKNFAESTGRKVFTVNFWKDTEQKFPKIFTKKASAKDVLQKLELVFNTPIDTEKSILILDEIQELPVVYSLFKTFKEDTSLPIIATGSYLKLFLANQAEMEIPIGCTSEYLVTPLTFGDYLQNKNKNLYEIYLHLPLDQPVEALCHNELMATYYEYLFTGGMPEVVSVFLETCEKQGVFVAAELARKIQEQLISSYRNDFLTFNQKKFAVGRDIVGKLALTFSAVPRELAKYRESEVPVGRFKFSSLGENATYKRVNHVFEYLSLSGLIIKSHIVKKPQYPLINEDETKNAFKCFYFDVGVLHAALDVPFQSIVNDELSCYKGPIAENFVAQQLFSLGGHDLFSWKEKMGREQEVEFLHPGAGLIPIEVKASKRGLPTKSLHVYINKYHPTFAIKIAPRNYGHANSVISMPIYFIERINELGHLPGG